jgi:hypothetical protein
MMRIYKLPDKEAIVNKFKEALVGEKLYTTLSVTDVIYSQAEKVDIDKLADAIGTMIDPWSIHIVYKIKQAIEEYING